MPTRSESTESPARKRGRPKLENNEAYDRRRAEIVDTAAEVFAERGFHATTVEDLVEATGLQRGGLYHYMRSKEDLLISIHERFIDPLLAEAREAVAADGPPDAHLRSLGHVLMNDIATYLPQVTVFLHEWRIIEHHERWKQIRASRQEFENLVSKVLQEGVDQKMFAIKDVRIATLGFLGMFNYSYQWFRPGGRVKADELADQFCDHFLDGIRA